MILKWLIINIEEENKIFIFPQKWACFPTYEVKRPPMGKTLHPGGRFTPLYKLQIQIN